MPGNLENQLADARSEIERLRANRWSAFAIDELDTIRASALDSLNAFDYQMVNQIDVELARRAERRVE